MCPYRPRETAPPQGPCQNLRTSHGPEVAGQKSLSPRFLLAHYAARLKALVWFWLIDEALSANLVYQSDYEIGSTTPGGKANEDHNMMMVMPR